MVGQTCRFAQISPPASAAMLAEPWGYTHARTSLRSFWWKFGRRGSARPTLVVSGVHCHKVVTQPKLCDDGARDMQPRVKPRILVVDDEPEAVELVEFNLRQAGYAVTTAADGAEALKKARSQTPDLMR